MRPLWRANRSARAEVSVPYGRRMDISGRDNVVAALTNPDLAVTPPAPPSDVPATLAWLRAGVPRFSRGPEHSQRRGYVQVALDRVDPATLRATARRLAEQTLAGSGADDPTAAVAREVPVRALADELGLRAVDVADVAAVAKVYLTGSDGADPADIAAADSAVARLVAAVGGGSDDQTAALVSILVQSCTATATLIGNAIPRVHDGLSSAEVVATTLDADPPTPPARRMATVDTRVGDVSVAAGETVFVAIGDAGYPFGAGPHACPGAAHATAIAEGAIDALRAAL
jgi:cytochrome P450